MTGYRLWFAVSDGIWNEEFPGYSQMDLDVMGEDLAGTPNGLERFNCTIVDQISDDSFADEPPFAPTLPL